jgi:WD40 repeat protein/transcriptional regulator with XRE-family HTH domain
LTVLQEGEIDPSLDTKSFGELLKWFRLRAHLKQEDVATLLEVSRPRISEWENSHFALKYRDRVAKLATIYGLSPAEKNFLLQAANFPESPPPPTFEPQNPYKGLAAFTQADRQAFFGRESLIKELLQVVERMATDQTTHRFLAAIGPSGSGKTSVIQAGLLPELREGAIAGSERWISLDPFRPRRNPLLSVADTLAPVLRRDPDLIRQELEDSALGLSHLIGSLTPQEKKPVLFVVDQFEELFNPDVEEQHRQHFIHLLLKACRDPESLMLLLLVFHTDCYSRLAEYPELAWLVATHQQLLLPLDRERETLRRIIEQPAALPTAKLTFEGNLLPLLQFTLDQLFHHRKGHVLTLQGYHKMGRVEGALACSIEQVYSTLPSQEHKHLTRFLFLRLLQIEPQSKERLALTRRQAMLDEFALPDPRNTQVLREVITLFVGKRLLVTNGGSDVSTLEVSHEALLKAWPRLISWTQQAREDIRLQQMISEAAASWKRHGEHADRLYRGSQLAEALKWKEGNLPSLEEEHFLQAGLKEQYRSQRRKTLLWMGIVLSVATGIGTGVFFTRQQNLPPSKGFSPGFFHKNLKGTLVSVAWSPDGKSIACGSSDNTLQILDASNTSRSFTGHTSIVWEVAWSPDGTRIASASEDKTVRIWNASDGKPLLTYTKHTDAVWGVAWSPDSTRIASSSADNTVQMWDARNANPLLIYRDHTDAVTGVAWSPDGTLIASVSDDQTARIWDARSTSNSLLTYTKHTNTVGSVAWSPDSRFIVSASDDRTVQIWDAISGKPLLTYMGHRYSVKNVVWSPDRRRIASASDDRTVQIWDASSGKSLLTYNGHAANVVSVAWSPDGTRIASSSWDKTVQCYDGWAW